MTEIIQVGNNQEYRWTPRLRIYGHYPRPATDPVVLNVDDENLWRESATPPGLRHNLVQTVLGPKDTLLDDPLDRQRLVTPSSYSIDYEIGYEDHGVSHWLRTPTRDEWTLRNNAWDYYQEALEAAVLPYITTAAAQSAADNAKKTQDAKQQDAADSGTTPPDQSPDAAAVEAAITADTTNLTNAGITDLRDKLNQRRGIPPDTTIDPGLVTNDPFNNPPTGTPGDFGINLFDEVQRIVGLPALSTDASKKALYTRWQNDAQRLFDWCKILEQLAVGGSGFFLSEQPNLYNSGAVGIEWLLAAANIPVKLTLTDFFYDAHGTRLPTNEIDRGIMLRVKLWDVLKEQANPQWAVKFGPGVTQYAVVFFPGTHVEFWHYKNLPVAQRNALEAQYNQLLDNGRLTAADNNNIKHWTDEIKAINRAAHTQKRTLTDAESAAIRTLKQDIQELKANKHDLTPDLAQQAKDLEAQIWYAKEHINLQENTHTFYGEPFDLAINFDRVGFVEVRLGINPPWLYHNKGIIKTNDYGVMLPANSRLWIESTGGRFGVVFGHPKHFNYALMLGQPWESDADFTDDSWRYAMGAIGRVSNVSDLVPGESPLVALPGCTITLQVTQISPPVNTTWLDSGGVEHQILGKAKYQFSLTMTSDGRYTPRLHWGQALQLAGDIPALGAPEYDSYDPTRPNRVGDILDVLFQEESDSHALHQTYVKDVFDQPSKMPLDLEGRAADISVLDTVGNEVFMAKSGLAREPRYKDRTGIQTTSIDPNGSFANALVPVPSSVAGIGFFVGNLEALLDRPILYSVIGNDKEPGDFLRELFTNAGLTSAQMVGIPVGPVAGMTKLPKATAGKAPDIRPQTHETYLTYSNGVIQKHCPGFRLIERVETGMTLEKWETARDRPTLRYSTTATVDSGLRIFRESADQGFDFSSNVANYYTEWWVVGAVNPATGQRFSWVEKCNEATDPRYKGKSLLHIGYPKPYFAPAIDALKSLDACVKYARSLRAVTGRPPFYVHPTVSFNPTVRAFDIPRVENIPVVIEAVRRGQFNVGAGQRMQLTCRIAYDVLDPRFRT